MGRARVLGRRLEVKVKRGREPGARGCGGVGAGRRIQSMIDIEWVEPVDDEGALRRPRYQVSTSPRHSCPFLLRVRLL